MKKLMLLFVLALYSYAAAAADMAVYTKEQVQYKGRSVHDMQDKPVTGMIRIYHPNGQVAAESEMVNGLPNGETRMYGEDGKLLMRANYRNDVAEGPQIVYYENGQPRVETNYKNGQMEGPFKMFSEKGSLVTEMNYVAGVPVGYAKTYYENGQVETSGVLKDGLPDSVAVKNFEDGSPMMTLNYVAGKLQGDVNVNRKGETTPVMQISYKDDVAMSGYCLIPGGARYDFNQDDLKLLSSDETIDALIFKIMGSRCVKQQ